MELDNINLTTCGFCGSLGPIPCRRTHSDWRAMATGAGIPMAIFLLSSLDGYLIVSIHGVVAG